jgi:hypothetical protein
LVIDPPVSQALAGGRYSFNNDDSTVGLSVGVSPAKGAPSPVGRFASDAVDAIGRQDTNGRRFNPYPNSNIQAIAQPYGAAAANVQSSVDGGAVWQPIAVTIGDLGIGSAAIQSIAIGGGGFGSGAMANAASPNTIEWQDFSSDIDLSRPQAPLSKEQIDPSLFEIGVGGYDSATDLVNRGSMEFANVTEADAQISGFVVHASMAQVSKMVAPPIIDYATRDSAAAAVNAVSREIVSPDDVIRAIRDSEIAIKVSGPGDSSFAGKRIWLFDEAEGAFVARDPERLTIVIDGGDSDSEDASQADQSFGQPGTVDAGGQEQSWIGAVRQFGREAARIWFDR